MLFNYSAISQSLNLFNLTFSLSDGLDLTKRDTATFCIRPSASIHFSTISLPQMITLNPEAPQMVWEVTNDLNCFLFIQAPSAGKARLIRHQSVRAE